MNDSNPEDYKNDKKRPQRKEKRPPRKITPRYLRNSGMYYLQRYTASSGHFKSVMTRKIQKSCRHHEEQDFDECLEMLETVTQELLDQKILDDDGYVRGMVTSLRRAGKSKTIIMGKLIQKRVPKNDIEDALKEYDEETYEDPREAEFFSALTLARKKRLGPFDNAQKYEEQKALQVFARNGFSYDTSRRVMNMSADDVHELGYAAY